jgi:ATP-dependent DNA ligase
MDKWAMLCKLKVEPFNDPNWKWERKLDGDRMSVLVTDNGSTSLLSRSGVDKTAQFPEIRLTLAQSLGPAVFDGEVVSADGLSFQEFNQRRMNRKDDIERMAVELPAMFVAFDCLMVGGRDIGRLPFAERRKALEDTLPAALRIGPVRVPAQFDNGVALFERANELKWEGVVGKDMRQAYMPGKRAWVKVKRWLEGEFWVVGFTAGTGKRSDRFGSLMLATWDAETGDFTRVAECGTGMDEAELERLDSVRCGMRMELGHVVLKAWPTPEGPGPGLKVRVKYVEVTNAGSLRFPVYLGQVREA